MKYITLLLLGLMVLSTPALAEDISFGDLQLSVMREDFNQTKVLAAQFIDQSNDKKEILEAKYLLGLSELRLGNYTQAEVIFDALINDDLEGTLFDKVMLGKFDAIYLNGDYEKANKVIKKLYKKHTMSEFLSLIYLKMARVNLKLTKWEDAREYLNKIVDNFPNSVEVYSAQQLLNEKQFFAVQVGSFLDVEKAKVLANELKERGEYAYMVETTLQDGQTYYRVRVGQNSVLADAHALKEKLSSLGYPTLIYP